MQPLALNAAVHNAPSNSGDVAKIHKAAADFESLLIEQMLRSARESSSDDSDEADSSDQNSSVMEMGEQQFAQTLARSGGLGIAKMVVAGLSEGRVDKYANR